MAPSHKGVLINEIPDGTAHGQSSILQSNCEATEAKFVLLSPTLTGKWTIKLLCVIKVEYKIIRC